MDKKESKMANEEYIMYSVLRFLIKWTILFQISDINDSISTI